MGRIRSGTLAWRSRNSEGFTVECSSVSVFQAVKAPSSFRRWQPEERRRAQWKAPHTLSSPSPLPAGFCSITTGLASKHPGFERREEREHKRTEGSPWWESCLVHTPGGKHVRPVGWRKCQQETASILFASEISLPTLGAIVNHSVLTWFIFQGIFIRITQSSHFKHI